MSARTAPPRVCGVIRRAGSAADIPYRPPLRPGSATATEVTPSSSSSSLTANPRKRARLSSASSALRDAIDRAVNWSSRSCG